MRLNKIFMILSVSFSLYIFINLMSAAVPQNCHRMSDKSTCNSTENLVSRDFFYPRVKGGNPAVFWWPRPLKHMSFSNGTLKLTSLNKKRIMSSFRIDIQNELLSLLSCSFDAKMDGKGMGIFVLSFYESDLRGKWLGEKDFYIKSEEFEHFSKLVSVPAKAASCRISLYIKGKNSTLFLKNLTLTPIKMIEGDGNSEIKIMNKVCSGIYILKTKPFYQYYDNKAAKILRRYLYLATGKVLPLMTLSHIKNNLKPGMILIGQAALQAGVIPKDSLAYLKPGGYAIEINNGVAGITGKPPGGVISGIYSFIEKELGIVFLSEYVTEPKILKRKLLILHKYSFHKSPAFEFRFIKNGDALGYTDIKCIGNGLIIGGHSPTTCHTAGCLIPFEKYYSSHPEYFALQKDGKRLHKDPRRTRFDVHLCMSNPDVRKLATARVLEWIKANPEAKYFWINPGDGRDRFCLCKNCLAMDEKPGNFTDRNLKFVNSIANAVAKIYPDKIILTLAYVNIEQPPIKIKPAPNVIVMYCPYPFNWSNHLEAFDPKYNAEGIKTLTGWLKWCPRNMGIFCYPSLCSECLNIWPAFYANYNKFVYYAKHGVKGIYFCGLRGRRGGYLGHNSFNELSRFVFAKVLWTPSLNVEKEISFFMKLYYGPAAPYMREYFDLIHNEVKSRHFVQNTEEVKRGFVTRELAEKAYDIFVKAENSVKNNPKYLDRVLKEKVYLLFSDLSDRCRTNGKITEEELPEYANRLAEFSKLCKKFNVQYFCRKLSPAKWFWNTAILKIKKHPWYKDPLIDALLRNPLDTIGKVIPRCQEKIEKGYSIPNIGMAGGISLKSYSYKCPIKNNVRILRRPSSGYGHVMTYLYLDSQPQSSMLLEVEGLDNDKEGKALMKIRINGKIIFKGPVPFKKHKWTKASFTIPKEVLKKGKNLVEFDNITPDIVTEEEKKAVAFIVGRKKNYFWGWYIISRIKFIFNKVHYSK